MKIAETLFLIGYELGDPEDIEVSQFDIMRQIFDMGAFRSRILAEQLRDETTRIMLAGAQFKKEENQ